MPARKRPVRHRLGEIAAVVRAKCGGPSTAAAKTPPPIGMTLLCCPLGVSIRAERQGLRRGGARGR